MCVSVCVMSSYGLGIMVILTSYNELGSVLSSFLFYLLEEFEKGWCSFFFNVWYNLPVKP